MWSPAKDGWADLSPLQYHVVLYVDGDTQREPHETRDADVLYASRHWVVVEENCAVGGAAHPT